MDSKRWSIRTWRDWVYIYSIYPPRKRESRHVRQRRTLRGMQIVVLNTTHRRAGGLSISRIVMERGLTTTYDTHASVERKENERVGWQCFLDSVVDKPIGVPPIDIGSPVWFMSVHIYERKGQSFLEIYRISAAEKKEVMSD